MFLTLLRWVSTVVPSITDRVTVQPDLVAGKDASYRIRELVLEASKAETDISLVYRDTLRAVRELFSRLCVIDSENRVTFVNAVHANQERSIAKLVQENNLILPALSIAQPRSEIDLDRHKYVPLVVSESIWDDRRQRARRVVSLTPKPIDIIYKISIFAKYKNDLDQLTEQVYSLFNPTYELQTSFATNVKVSLDEENSESFLEGSDREDRLLVRSFSIRVEGYIPSPKFIFSSTGKIERFYAEVTAVNELPTTTAVTGNRQSIAIKYARNPNISKRLEITPENDASYRVRELILETAKADSNVSLVYKDTLRSMQNLFSNLRIIDAKNEVQKVRCINANPERAIAKLTQENNLILPIVSVAQPNSVPNQERQKFFPLVVSESIWDDRTQRAKRVVSLAPRPIDITYKVTLMAKYRSDLDQLSEQIYLLFNPTHELKTNISNNTKALLTEETSESSFEVGDKEDRILMRSFSVTVETYVPTPKFTFSSTGKIERFIAEVKVVNQLPEESATVMASDTLLKEPLEHQDNRQIIQTPPPKDASYRIRELILETAQEENNISLVYKDSLRAIQRLFSQCKLIDYEQKVQPVKCITANPERPIAKLVQEDNLILPIISVGQPITNLNTNRQKYAPIIVSESVWDDRIQRARRVVSLAPKPVDISYKITLFAKYKSDLDQLTEQIHLLFTSPVELQTSIANNTKAFLTEELDESSMLVEDKEDRILMRSFTINVETYIPSPRFTFTSTGEIERFNYDFDVVKEII